mmetsp:Transcript_29808/g.60704  ORF Transcript_29808/g.60704 Transcript_29808/m.60704 type:complete len:464 (+) Transcript_29808:432-1823(+)
MFKHTSTSPVYAFSMNMQQQKQPHRTQQSRQQCPSLRTARKRTRSPTDPDSMDENNDDNSFSFSASSPAFFSQYDFQPISASAAISPMNTDGNYYENSFCYGRKDFHNENGDNVTASFQSHGHSLSQSSTTSTITFASVAATDSSSVRMDLGDQDCHDREGEDEDGFSDTTVGRGGDDKDGGEAIPMVGSVIYGGSSRSFKKDWKNQICSRKNYDGVNGGERRRVSSRPSKRAKATMIDEEMAPPSLVMTVEVSKSFGSLGLGGEGGLSNGKNGGLNGDGAEGCDGVCCHVCHSSSSSSADANKSSSGKCSGLRSSRIGVGRAISAAQDNTTSKTCKTSKAKSQSLLTFFKPVSENQTKSSPKFHQMNLSSLTKSATTESDGQKKIETSDLQNCRYCDKPTCVTCTRQCEQCERWFCTFCSKVDYADVVERILCFECDEEVARSDGRRDIAGCDDDDVDMMDL